MGLQWGWARRHRPDRNFCFRPMPVIETLGSVTRKRSYILNRGVGSNWAGARTRCAGETPRGEAKERQRTSGRTPSSQAGDLDNPYRYGWNSQRRGSEGLDLHTLTSIPRRLRKAKSVFALSRISIGPSRAIFSRRAAISSPLNRLRSSSRYLSSEHNLDNNAMLRSGIREHNLDQSSW